MNLHDSDLLAAYHDDELSADRRRQVEIHLQDCPDCRAALDALENLSLLLKTETLPDRTRPERFAAQVQLRLPHPPPSHAGQKSGQPPRWMLGIPLALLTSWAFLQAALWVTALIFVTAQALDLHTAPLGSWMATGGRIETRASLLLLNAILLTGTTVLWSAWGALWFVWKKNQILEPSTNRL